MSQVRKSMRLLFTVLFFITLACSSVCISPLYAKNLEEIQEIVVFGDSLSDTGNLYVETGNTFPASPPYDAGRFSNGLVWVEYLAMAMSVDLPTPSNLGGTNYAWGGAETGDGLSARNTFNIGEQINGEEINSFLKYNRPKDNQLFIIWAGANDFNNVDEETPLPKPQDIVDNIIEHIRTLALASPDEKLRFMIPNLPLMGQTPGAQCLGLYVDPDIPLIFDGLSIDFNITLDRELKKLKKELKKDHSIKIILHKLDVFSLFQKMIINPAAFGFTNVSDTVRIREEGDLGCPLEVTDTGGKFVNDKYPDEDPDGYLFFDAIHPTTAAHKIIAEMALELINGQSIETECAD